MSDRGPSLGFAAIGVIIFVGVIMLIYTPGIGMYNTFMEDNGGTIDPIYAEAYANITGNKGGLNSWEQNLTMKSILAVPYQFVSAILNTFAIGFDAIRAFSELPTFFGAIFGTLSYYTKIPEPLFWMVTVVFAIWFAIKFIKALRGQVSDI